MCTYNGYVVCVIVWTFSCVDVIMHMHKNRAQSQMSLLTTLFETGSFVAGCVHQASSPPRIFLSFSVVGFLGLQILLHI